MAEKIWHAVYTRPGKEKKVADVLTKKKIANYIPLYERECMADGRKKLIIAPVFPRYVFISVENNEWEVLDKSRHILSFVYWMQKPAVIQNEEISAMKLFLNEYICTRLEMSPVIPGEEVSLNNELQLRKRGNIVEANVATVKLTLPSLGRVLVAEVRKEKGEQFTYAKEMLMKNILES
jgi:transcription termination/antitermination protein NusG